MLEKILNDVHGGGGFEFKPMNKDDWQAFAGAEEGSRIAYTESWAYILTPNGTLDVIGNDDWEAEPQQYRITVERVI